MAGFLRWGKSPCHLGINRYFSHSFAPLSVDAHASAVLCLDKTQFFTCNQIRKFKHALARKIWIVDESSTTLAQNISYHQRVSPHARRACRSPTWSRENLCRRVMFHRQALALSMTWNHLWTQARVSWGFHLQWGNNEAPGEVSLATKQSVSRHRFPSTLQQSVRVEAGSERQ